MGLLLMLPLSLIAINAGIPCSWDYCVSLWFEWKILTKEYPFKWPLIPYFLTRYFGLASLIANLIFVYPYKELNCQVLQKSIVVFGNIGITAASGNLMVRAIIVWDYRRWVIVLLSLLLVGQWVLVFVGLGVGAVTWNRLLGACVPIGSRAEYMILLGAFSIYTAGFDFIIVVFTVLGVRKSGRDSLASLLRRQGIGYFGLILIVHTITIALVFYDQNSFLGIYGGLTAVVFSPIVACRVVRAVFDAPLQNYRETTKSPCFPSCDTSRSPHPAPQETRVQFTTRINLSQPEAEEYEMQSTVGKRSCGLGSSVGGTTTDNV
ncbi:hypothetical protein BDM02DRAFT_265998 [Thelephora ganbajun]|uniref:Uncharacterized protein n=1 Tax=Thelephora ganbajun TaxID=370292 RepID=A0ACB6ZAR5_THEGA|nr:hypothetical protein BDM02DRAFT_265998 [Thelephora ganbajun]